MAIKKVVAKVTIVGVGLIGIAWMAQPASAGDTRRINGCAAHWRDTAAWNECVSDPSHPVDVRFNVDCNNQFDWQGNWKTVNGYVNPLDQHSCRWSVQQAFNSYR